MDNQRAREIISSPVMANVIHNGNKVYMERLNEPDQCCVVHYLNDPVTKINVPVSSLTENK
ncbi:H-type small acid-soluble spore protein [Caproiciproducens sp. CPB-2]|uniref:H-type small acid-soluble spore protein n=1 Tax=Caproiciproducens sp. CPB-2 TaxID=3030017 RepID=UPI0023DB3C72|nr:H-type small acid-soluble spore protein [Caproiciproducens sp. CPB-2]MDF1496077.1 H-type small acid-soluble spore protein [Caproiciproducens sp. CPB-2]